MPASFRSRSTSRVVEPGHRVDVEAGERAAEVLALAQDRQPRQARLERLEGDAFEEGDVAVHGSTPLGVVVLDVVGRRQAPRAPHQPVVDDGRSRSRPRSGSGLGLGEAPRAWLQRASGPRGRSRDARPARPARPSTPIGSSNDSDHTKRVRSPGSSSSSKVPVPLTTRPVCSTSQRVGGSHTVMTKVSRKPARPAPLHASITLPSEAPSPLATRTSVPSIHSPCRSQSNSRSHTA